MYDVKCTTMSLVVSDVARLLPIASAESRRIAFALASQHGHTEVVQIKR